MPLFDGEVWDLKRKTDELVKDADTGRERKKILKKERNKEKSLKERNKEKSAKRKKVKVKMIEVNTKRMKEEGNK